jgi:hypothetical protein
MWRLERAVDYNSSPEVRRGSGVQIGRYGASLTSTAGMVLDLVT